MPLPEIAKDSRIDRVFPGQPIPPLVRVRTFSPNDWEEFICEWATSLKLTYHTVMRCGGAGDMGRDVVGYIEKPSLNATWVNYQCKHYDHPLHPSDVWLELGKLAYYTSQSHFTIPREYYLICPHDVGTSVMRMLGNAEKLREGVIENWDRKCRTGITKERQIPLSGKLLKHVKQFPFEIVSTIPVLKIIEQHRETPWYVHRFGGGLPDRPKHESPPNVIRSEEIRYVSELLTAYSDHVGQLIDNSTLEMHPKLKRHFVLSRASFYSAEALKSFSRDHLPENEYGRLQNEIYDGVQETYIDVHEDSYRKILEVTKAAISIEITDHPLLPVIQPPDRRGICHQLVEMKMLTWSDDNG